MNKEQYTERLMDFLASEAYAKDPRRLEAFLQENPACQSAWEDIAEGWEVLGNAREEVPMMPDRFLALDLPLAERSSPAKSITIQLPRWSVAATTLLLGLAVGLLWPRDDRSDEISQLTEELQKTRLSMQVLYLQSPDAGERIYAASLVEQQPLTAITTEAWLRVLQEDPSLSVRMAALDVLTREEISQALQERIVASMAFQESPMLRIEMAEVAQGHQWTEAIPYLEKWIADPLSPPPLREALKRAITKLKINV